MSVAEVGTRVQYSSVAALAVLVEEDWFEAARSGSQPAGKVVVSLRSAAAAAVAQEAEIGRSEVLAAETRAFGVQVSAPAA